MTPVRTAPVRTPSVRTVPARAVIGAGYGDEGKGLLVDALAAAAGGRVLVVRANGGAQAGHTVVAPDGRRHVFGHVGAGALAGAPTLLGPLFVSNPVLLARELAALRALGVAPRVLADGRGPVTTPFDMLLNQAAERARGAGRHGSVGVGFGETIERCLSPTHALHVRDLGRGRPWLRARLAAIAGEHVPRRLLALGVTPDPALRRWLADPALVEAFLDDAVLFRDRTEPADAETLRRAPALLFEGAQGLLLDERRGAFPHVTRSRTGLANVVALMAEAGLADLRVTYATRAYVTRHGAGPLPHARPEPVAPGVRDRTNRPHPFQGTLRHALLDVDVLRDAVRADLGDAPPGLVGAAGLAMTCLDQVGTAVPCVLGGGHRVVAAAHLPGLAAAHAGLAPHAASHGETRAHVAWTHVVWADGAWGDGARCRDAGCDDVGAYSSSVAAA